MVCERERQRAMARVSFEQARAIFGDAPPPETVSERQFDWFDDKLYALARTPQDRITREDLWYYLHDLAYVDLQPDLFAYLFPVCLNLWNTSLMRNQDCSQGDAEFHYALLHGRILEQMVTPAQRDRILDFFHDGFLDRLDQERGFDASSTEPPAYSWMRRLNSLGLVTPLIERIWTSWWRMETPGQAVSALMYASGLMYRRGENPIFPVSPLGAPPLWENDSYIFDSGWLPQNLDFLWRTLSVGYLREKVIEAASHLAAAPEAEMASRLAREFERRVETVEARISTLLLVLVDPAPCTVDW
jgi:hypothetical protein